MLVAFWKAATSFPDFFYFQKRVFFSFLFCFLFICICCVLKIGNLVSCFFLLLLYFQKRVFSSIFCFLSHLLLSHFEKRHPLSSFFSFEISIDNDLFFRAPFSRQPFQMGTNEESWKYLDNKLVKNCSFLLSSEDVVTHRESWI